MGGRSGEIDTFLSDFQIFCTTKPSISLGKVHKTYKYTGVWFLWKTVERREERGLGILNF